MESPKDAQFRKKLESIVAFKAKDFEGAHAKAIEIGMKRSKDESVRNTMGDVEIQLTFCYVQTLDVVGENIEGREIWSSLTDVRELPEVCVTNPPAQTI